ncbi:MAG: hypothetical protein QM781_06125 [Chitinophagaceae bacterium]
MSLEQSLLKYEGQPITQGILKDLLKEYLRPHNKVRELEKRNILTPVKRGLYIIGPSLSSRRPSLYLLANHIYGPSYVSLEAALSYWGLIPEQVATVSSMTTGSSKVFRTSIGLFQYTRLRLPYYSFGIRMVESASDQAMLIASPEKALCDIIAVKGGLLLRSITQTRDFLTEDLRMERDTLTQLDQAMIQSWIPDAPKKSSLVMLLKTLEGL